MTQCKHCGRAYALHSSNEQECPGGENMYEPEERLFTASDLARAREEGRREAEAKFWPIFLWLLGYTDFPERKPGEGAFYWRGKLRRDLENTITDFAALLAEGKKEAHDEA